MARLSPIECALELATDPAAPGSEPPWHVLRAELAERLDHPWLAQVTVVTDVIDARVEALLGRAATLWWERPGAEVGAHHAHGLVTRAEYLGTFDRQLHARLRLEPALALLRHGRRRRIFEDASVPAIVTEVLGPVLDAHGAELLGDDLAEPHAERDYCVQYDETDLDFVRRILAEDGIALTFDPLAEADHVRLVDTNDAFLPAGHDRLPMGPHGLPEVPLIPIRAEEAEEESIQSLRASRAVTTARFTASAWDFKHQPPTRLRSTASTNLEHDCGERIDHATMRLVELQRGDGPTDDTTPALAQLAAERAHGEAVELTGRSNVVCFAPGATFHLCGHPHDELDDRDYVLTRVLHRIEIPSAAVGGDGRSSSYLNELSCVPLSQPYRPSLLAAPRAVGPETALVVGPEPDETHTDVHGRVRVRMHWDDRDELPSVCWLRVGQAWAGPGFGTLFLPRVGMEVVVSFLGGNPDRPLVTGCVYNARNVPPVDLPKHRTQSTIRTSSSPGGRGHNELRFEDGAGHEEVYLRAQRNLRERVGVDHSTTVGRDQALHVGRNRQTAVDGDHSSTIAGENRHAVGGDEYRHIKGMRSIGVDQSDHKLVGEHLELYVNASKSPEPAPPKRVDGAKVYVGGDAHVEASRSHTLLCGNSRITMSPGQVEVTAHEGITLTVGSTTLELTADGLYAIGDALRLVGADRTGSSDERSQLVLAPRTAVLTSPTRAHINGGSAKVELSDDIEAKGRRVRINGVDSTELGGTTISIDADTTLELFGKAVKWVGDLVEIN